MTCDEIKNSNPGFWDDVYSALFGIRCKIDSKLPPGGEVR